MFQELSKLQVHREQSDYEPRGSYNSHRENDLDIIQEQPNDDSALQRLDSSDADIHLELGEDGIQKPGPVIERRGTGWTNRSEMTTKTMNANSDSDEE